MFFTQLKITLFTKIGNSTNLFHVTTLRSLGKSFIVFLHFLEVYASLAFAW